MGMDRTGVWHPLCDISSCKEDQAVDGELEVDVFVAGEFRTARIHVCGTHRDRYWSRRLVDAAS